MEATIKCPKCGESGEKLKGNDEHWHCIRCSYLFRITRKIYFEAIRIFLKHSYPDKIGIQMAKIDYAMDTLKSYLPKTTIIDSEISLLIDSDEFVIDHYDNEIRYKIVKEFQKAHIPVYTENIQ